MILGNKRTMVTVHNRVAELLAIKLDETPETKEAKKAIRLWLQHQLDEINDPQLVYVSQWLQDQTLMYLVDKDLREKYLAWIDKSSPDKLF